MVIVDAAAGGDGVGLFVGVVRWLGDGAARSGFVVGPMAWDLIDAAGDGGVGGEEAGGRSLRVSVSGRREGGKDFAGTIELVSQWSRGF